MQAPQPVQERTRLQVAVGTACLHGRLDCARRSNADALQQQNAMVPLRRLETHCEMARRCVHCETLEQVQRTLRWSPDAHACLRQTTTTVAVWIVVIWTMC